MSRRSAILEKSLALFARHGFEGVSMRDIAHAVGLSVSSLYAHFPGKEALYLAVLDELVEARFHEEVLGRINDDLPPQAQLREACFRMVQLLSARPEVAQLVMWVLLDQNHERKSAIVRNIWHRKFAWMVERFEQLVPREQALGLALQFFGLIFSEFAMRDCVMHIPEFEDMESCCVPQEVAGRIWAAIEPQLKGNLTEEPVA